MRNPLRSEADAFRFVWLTIGYFALIVIGSVINSWVGLAVFLVLTGLALWSILRRGEHETPVQQTPAESPVDEYRILVVANETVGGSALLAEIRSRSAGRKTVVFVVCPALNSPLRHWVSDEDEARAAANARLDQSLAAIGCPCTSGGTTSSSSSREKGRSLRDSATATPARTSSGGPSTSRAR
jgi:hypothetical protein